MYFLPLQNPTPPPPPCVGPVFFLYLPSTDTELTFLNKLEGFFLLLTVSSNREWSALDFTLLGTVRSLRLHLYHSQLIKKLAHANDKVLISNRATSVKVRK